MYVFVSIQNYAEVRLLKRLCVIAIIMITGIIFKFWSDSHFSITMNSFWRN